MASAKVKKVAKKVRTRQRAAGNTITKKESRQRARAIVKGREYAKARVAVRKSVRKSSRTPNALTRTKNAGTKKPRLALGMNQGNGQETMRRRKGNTKYGRANYTHGKGDT